MQAQKRLLNDVSHELRSPLARLRVALALAERDPTRIPEQLARIDRETERLDELIEQLEIRRTITDITLSLTMVLVCVALAGGTIGLSILILTNLWKWLVS